MGENEVIPRLINKKPSEIRTQLERLRAKGEALCDLKRRIHRHILCFGS